MPTQKQRKQREKEKRIEAERWRRKRQQRESLQRLKDLAKLILHIRFLDLAKEFGAAVGTLITSILARPRNAGDRTTTKIKSAEESRFEYAPIRPDGVYKGRYFGRTPHISDLIRDLALPGPSGDEAFAELLKHIPVEAHEWAHTMFTGSRERAFRTAARGNKIGAAETILNMKMAARSWKFEQEEAVRQKKMEIEKKLKRVNANLNHNEEPDEPPGHNPKM
ncbi:hypothetical protein QD357_23215 [Rhizobium sp. BR 317]|uniref:hypothetical protein n=1 Tax=Rhizobium sp. BR 317 TaxID=3040015 RepID=UPI0039BF2821